MTRSPIGLLIVLALLAMMLYGSGAISWAPTPWEQHAAQVVTKDAGKAAKSIGVQVNIPPQPPGITPAKTPAQATTTVYPTPSGVAIPAPSATPAITSAYCSLEGIASGTDGCP